MVYINSDGTTSTKRKRKWGFLGINFIKETIVSVFDFVGLFFRTLTSSPATLENERVGYIIILQIKCILYHIDAKYLLTFT
jgi:hypothetical protein